MATIVNNPGGGDTGAGGWIIAIVVIIILVLLALFLFPNLFDNEETAPAPVPATETGGEGDVFNTTFNSTTTINTATTSP